ncbi:peptidoglycan DD-metalloendopeptidase family protein [Hominimerdicola sp. 21CYCFAH17_S]
MLRTNLLKRTAAFAAALALGAGLFSDSFTQPAIVTTAESESFDITSYAERLKEISEEQERLDNEIEAAQDDIKKETEKQEAILKKIKSVNEKIEVLNSYMTQLEIEISTNKRLIANKKQEIEKGVDDFKKRLRAMYLAGDESYTSVILNSNDFYDILMRMELVKRVASHDNQMIDDLIAKKEEYEKAQKELEDKQSEYDSQYDELNKQKAELDELYDSSKKAKKELQDQKKKLEEQNQDYLEERRQFEADLSGILKSSYGDSSDDTMREAAELAANSALESLHEYYGKLEEDGQEISEDECQYKFAWPVPGHYYVSSGVGERWGTYHTGLDITGAKGTDIHASESGTVIRTNTSCEHDYGKEESCGCGGGYGNFIIIDHGNEFITLYGHLTEVDVEVGDVVKKGDLIGHMGSTGFSTGDHLHFEIRYQGYYLNPAAYVSIN